MKKTIITILIVVVVVILAGGAAYFFWPEESEININSFGDQLIGGQTDVHGCLGPAGYSWCEQLQKCVRTWEEACTPEDALRQAGKIIDPELDIGGIFNEDVEVFWNTDDGELKLVGQSIGYGDELLAQKINNIDRGVVEEFERMGFKTDAYNAGSGSYEQNIQRMRVNHIVCNIITRNNDVQSRSEIEIACAEIK